MVMSIIGFCLPFFIKEIENGLMQTLIREKMREYY